MNRPSPVRLPNSHLAHNISITYPPSFTLQFDRNDEHKLILQSHGTPGHYLLSVIVRTDRHTAKAYYIDSLPGYSRDYYAEMQRWNEEISVKQRWPDVTTVTHTHLTNFPHQGPTLNCGIHVIQNYAYVLQAWMNNPDPETFIVFLHTQHIMLVPMSVLTSHRIPTQPPSPSPQTTTPTSGSNERRTNASC